MSTRDIVKKDPANFTPTLGNYTDLQPFRFWCQKVLPLVYDDSLSYYELLCKVVDYLNKTMEDVTVLNGDVTNLHAAYVKLQDYVNNYFSTLDIQKEINNKLDEMVKDGTLSNILFNIPKFSTFNPILIGRTWGLSTDRNHAQGGCYINNGCVVYGRTSTPPTSDAVTLTDVDTINENVRREVTLNLGHCDDMTYIPELNVIAIIPSIHEPNAGVWNSIILVDYETFTIKEEIETPRNYGAIGYDRSTKVLYTSDSNMNFYTFNLETKEEIKLFTYSYIDPIKFTKQGMCVENNRFYFSTAYPNNVLCFDNKGNTLNILNIASTTIENFKFGELEWIDVNDNVMYLGSSIRTPSSTYELAYTWKTNILHGEISRLRGGYDPISTLYVDSSSNVFRVNGSSSRPFPTIDEAMLYNVDRRSINVKAGAYKAQIFGFTRILCEDNVTIDCQIRTGYVYIKNATVKGDVYIGGTLNLDVCHIETLTNDGTLYLNTYNTGIKGNGLTIPVATSISYYSGNANGFCQISGDNIRATLANYLTTGSRSKFIILGCTNNGVNYTLPISINTELTYKLKNNENITVNSSGETIEISVSDGSFKTTPNYALKAVYIYN